MSEEKNAIVYYSNTGNTKKLIDELEKQIPCDIIEIQPKKEYKGFFGSVIKVIIDRLLGKRSSYKTPQKDFSKYSTVYLGFPVWAGTLPEFLQEYLSDSNMNGVPVIPIYTAAGTGEQSSLNTINEILPDSEIKDHFFTSKTDEKDFSDWLEKLNEN